MKDYIPMDMMGMYLANDYGENGVKFYSVARYGREIIREPKNPVEPIFWLTKKEAKLLDETTCFVEESGIKVYNMGIVPDSLLKIFPLIDRYSIMDMDVGTGENKKSSLIIAKEGKGIFTKKHVELLKSVKEPFSIAMSNAIRYLELMQLKESLVDENKAMRTDLGLEAGEQIIGAEFGLRGVMEMVRTVARTNSPVLLMGETGTGKEIIAKSIHQNSSRSDLPFVRVQCGAMPESLLDSELFGHEKGSFTGAIGTKKGRFERANFGTIFLDEIGELSLEAQVKLLRVLQEKEFERVGGHQTIKADVRVIAATHRNLHEMIKEGTFREDLWFRLNVFPIVIPPLRDRKGDMPALIQHFILKKTRELSLPASAGLAPGVLDKLMKYGWPGNVRELQNVIERGLIISNGAEINIPSSYVPENLEKIENEPDTPETYDEVIRKHIIKVLKKTHGKIEGQSGAAKLLGLNPSTLRGKLRKYKIPFGTNSKTNFS
jgi:transcriptional regulator with GAF, ATPase, and Fis domain